MRIQRFLHLLNFINNLSVTCASTFFLLSILHLFLSQPIWYNKNIKINSKPLMLKNLQNKISVTYMIFLTLKMSLERGMKWRLVIILTKNLISNGYKLSVWKKLLQENQSDSSNLVLLDHQLLKNNRTLEIEKMNSKEIYSIMISSKVIYQRVKFIQKKISLYNFPWKDIYTLPSKVTTNVYLRLFQYKILNNVLYLNKKLHTFGLSNTRLCSFCRMEEEKLSHLFYYVLIWKISGITFRLISLAVCIFHS